MTDGLKEVPGGGVAPGRSCGDSAPLIATALLAGIVALGVGSAGPLVAHVVIVPTAPGEIVATVPATGWTAPSAVPGLAPSVGIVPGTVAVVGRPSNVEGVSVDVVDVAGAVRVVGVVNPTCAKAELQPNKTVTAVMSTKVRIGASFSLLQSHTSTSCTEIARFRCLWKRAIRFCPPAPCVQPAAEARLAGAAAGSRPNRVSAA
jgi:hypothetical protein